MKNLIVYFIALFMFVSLSGCTDNTRAKVWGGTSTIELKQNERLVNITWKDNNLWILTKVDSKQMPIVYTFREQSTFGMVEGALIIKEK